MTYCPNELLYTTEHQWLRVGESSFAFVGITDFAQVELGEVVYVEGPSVRDRLKMGEPFGEVESNKTSSEVYAPCAAEVVDVNARVYEDPSLLNRDPYGDGWLIQIRVLDPSQLKQLLDAKQYEELVR